MTQFTTFKLGLAGISLFLNVICVAMQDGEAQGSMTTITTANSTIPSHGSGIIPNQTSDSTIHNVPIIQLSETDQQLEELLLTTQQQSAGLTDEGSGDEPSFIASSGISAAKDATTPQLPAAVTVQEASSAKVTEVDSDTTTVLPPIEGAVDPSKTPENIAENVSMQSSSVPADVISTTEADTRAMSHPANIPTVIPESVVHITESATVVMEGATPVSPTLTSTTNVPETTLPFAITATTPEPRNENFSTSSPLEEVLTTISPTVPLTPGQAFQNESNQEESTGNLPGTEKTTESNAATSVISVSQTSLVSGQKETEYTTTSSSTIEHLVTAAVKPDLAIPELTTMRHESSTEPYSTIEFSSIPRLTTEATFTTHSVSEITTEIQPTVEETASMAPVISTAGITEKPSDLTSPLPPETFTNYPTEVVDISQHNETQPLEPSKTIYISTTEMQTAISSENQTEKPPPQSKSYEDLNEPEFFNSVTTVFILPPRMKGLLFDKDTFKETVICLINIYELQKWPESIANVSGCGESAEFGVNSTSKLLSTSDLVIIEPSPKLNNNEIIVSFFTRNSTSKYSGGIVSRNRTLSILNNHKEFLGNQMGMNITQIYGGMRISHLISPTTEPFYMRHSLLLIVLMVVAGACILIIIAGLVYIKCCSKKTKWSSTSSYTQEKTKLQRDMLCSEMGQHLNSDDDIHKDETLRAMNNGNGFFSTDTGSGSSVIPIGDEDGWVIPYDELSPEEKTSVDVEDTKL